MTPTKKTQELRTDRLQRKADFLGRFESEYAQTQRLLDMIERALRERASTQRPVKEKKAAV